MCMYITATSTM